MPDTRVVYATSTLSACTADGVTVRLVEGEPWDGNDPFVRARPELFTSEPTQLRRTVRVEQATAAPGEQRNARRPQR